MTQNCKRGYGHKRSSQTTPCRWLPLPNTPMQENSEKMCTVHLWPVKHKGISRGFEPRASWRELEQLCRELSVGESQQRQPRQPEQQCWLPPGVRPVAQKQSRMTASNRLMTPPLILSGQRAPHTMPGIGRTSRIAVSKMTGIFFDYKIKMLNLISIESCDYLITKSSLKPWLF